MKIAIIDADLVGNNKHRFPNLVCMKLSAYYKSLGNDVELKMDYEDLEVYDKVFISKVFIQTEIPCEPEDKSNKNESTVVEWYKNNPFLKRLNIEYGGTGFFYDKAPKLPSEIEHFMPDYHLYDDWVNIQINNGIAECDGKEDKIAKLNKIRKNFTYYLDYSIGYMTRGCIRQCSFCVNKNYNRCELHSNLSEFLDETRSYICLLDDNVLACKDWKEVFEELISTDKKFQFKQGCDERLLTDEKCEYLFNKSKWIGDRIFAFDNIKDREVIERKLQMIRRHTNNQIKFYTFCGYNHNNIGTYDEEFWVQDIVDLFERIKILMTYGCLPYVMRYKDYELSPYRGIYITVASWCNQPNLFRKMSFEEFSKARGMSNENYKKYKLDFDSYLADGGKKGSCWRYYDKFEEKYPEIAEKYFHMKWNYSNRNS